MNDLLGPDVPVTAAHIWTTYLLPGGTKLLYALLIFFIGRIVGKLIVKSVGKLMARANIDDMIAHFVTTVLGVILLMVVLVIALSQLGLDTTSVVAILGAAGLAIGLSLKDSLSHFAAGIMLITFRPFKVGNYVEVDGVGGSVLEINLFSTILKTPDNRVVTVPNSNVFGNTMTNFSANSTRRLDLVIGIGYGSDLLKAKNILKEMLEADERVLKDPAYVVAVNELADSSVNFVVRPWVNSADYWAVKWDLTERIKLKFDEEGIEIPFPQMSVHIEKDD
ncbi:MAG: mechanosensitive ion channel family protein [Oceanobacter sp.]